MKPIPTLEELTEIAQRDAKHVIYSAKTEQLVDSSTAPLFAAIAERDAEIERLRGLLSQAYAEAELLNTFPDLRSSVKQSVANIAKYLGWAIKEPEPAKPETFEAHGETWTRHNPGDPMPVDGEREIYGLDTFGSIGPFPAQSYDWSTDRKTGLGVNLIGYRLADEAKPDPYAHLREAEGEGNVIQFNYGPSGTPKWRDLPRPRYSHRPEFYRVKPWTLPPPPEGKQWHRTDWTEDMLPEGWRSLLLGEMDTDEDEELYPEGWEKAEGKIHWPTHTSDPFTRTRRPLPEPQTWVDLGPQDCPPGSVFQPSGGPKTKYYAVLYVGREGVRFSDDFITWGQLNRDGDQINRSISKGKWDPNAWEPCRKLFK